MMNMRTVLSRFKPAAYAATALGWRALNRVGLISENKPVGVVIERADWAIRWWGTYTVEEANRIKPGTAHITPTPARLVEGIVQFGSQYQWVEWSPFLSPRCRFVSTFFHGKPEDGPQVARHIDRFLATAPKLDAVVASSSILRERLQSWGVPKNKIHLIPIGCETNRFVRPTEQQRNEVRARFSIQPHEIVIGSFQKDGEGWGEGEIPKRIKGPDVFLSVVERLAKTLPIFVLLSGPARGYVKKGLERLNIRYTHHYAPNRDALAQLYHALDLYLVTSREEGGPMALMESMASGVPVVSTRVGMAVDLIKDRINGALVNVEDIETMAQRAQELLALPKQDAETLKKTARNDVLSTDWSVVGRRHLEEIWLPLMAK